MKCYEMLVFTKQLSVKKVNVLTFALSVNLPVKSDAAVCTCAMHAQATRRL